MMSNEPTFSVILCTYSDVRWDDLVEAVDSVRQQTRPAHEIIVSVDHNPSLASRVRAMWDDVKVVENNQFRGAGGTRNSAAAVANGNVLVFLDDDATAPDNWLEQFALVLDDPAVLGAGGQVRPQWEVAKPRWFPDEFNWVVGCTHPGMPQVAAPVRNLICANMTVCRKVFTESGGFRHGVGHKQGIPYGCEETELCIRIGQGRADRHWRYVPQIFVDHKVTAERARWRYFRSRCAYEGRSKAYIATFIGVGDGTSAERSYVMSTLPRGILRGLGEAMRGDFSGLLRASAIVAGFAITTINYAGSLLAYRVRIPFLFGHDPAHEHT